MSRFDRYLWSHLQVGHTQVQEARNDIKIGILSLRMPEGIWTFKDQIWCQKQISGKYCDWGQALVQSSFLGKVIEGQGI